MNENILIVLDNFSLENDISSFMLFNISHCCCHLIVGIFITIQMKGIMVRHK